MAQADADEAAVALTAAMVAATGRKCGSCSLCCKVLPIGGSLAKPANQWCRHCRPGAGGCAIYAERPIHCRGFACGWLVNPAMGDEWFPARSKIVVRQARHGDIAILEFVVDPSYPDKWREEPYHSAIRRAGAQGGSLVQVVVGDKVLFVFPTKIIERRASITAEEKVALAAEFDEAVAGIAGHRWLETL